MDTMQEHQMILTNATLSKDSDTISISVIMAVYEIIFFFNFQLNLRNQETVYQHNITEKYYKIDPNYVETFKDCIRIALILHIYLQKIILSPIWLCTF